MLRERYRIDNEIGAGAHGKVYSGHDQQQNLTVAIKRLRAGLVSSDPSLLSRFQREAEALRRLNHPNIVQVFDAFADEDEHYIVMEYLPASLRGLLDETPCLPVERTLRIALDLSDALARAHRLNIIHRDLKPANVLLAADGTPRLTDFGVALIRDQERVTDSNSIVGTLNYISPEALNGEAPSECADIWSFGVMVFEMLAGRRPFMAETPTTLIVDILTRPPADLEALRPDVPATLVDLIYRMLEKNPRARIASVRRVGAEIEALLRLLETGEIMHLSAVSTPPVSVPVTVILETPQTLKNNLPAQTTPFVGRDWEIEELLRMLHPSQTETSARPRLVTLIAPGGMGKSRLSLEVASRLVEMTESNTELYSDGVYFVPLAALTAPERIPNAIAEALGLLLQNDGREPLQQLQAYLATRRLLLILDNFEHLTAGAESLTRLLAATSHLTLLVTSRERLNLSAEHLFTLDGLTTPPDHTAKSLMEYSAVRLFVYSAQRSQPRFTLQASDVSHVTTICRLVQGLPLGLVLAATWAEMLTPSEIAHELSQSAEFLEANMQDLPERHRSMRAVFDYSWQRLSPGEQRTLARLSVFHSLFSRAAAQAVSGASLRDLMQLVNKSLLHRDAESGYYTLHELIRQFAESRLKENEADYQAALNAHAHYYCSWLKDLTAAARGPQMQAVLPMDAEIDNIRQAWQRAIATKNAVALAGSEETLYVYYRLRSLENERLSLFGQAIAALETLPAAADRDLALGRLYARHGELYMRLLELSEGRTALERSVALLRGVGDETGLVYALSHLGELISRQMPTDEASAAYVQEALALAEKHQIKAYQAMIYIWHGFRANRDYRLEEGLEWAQKGLHLCQVLQNPEGTADSLRVMGMLYHKMGQTLLSIERLEEAIPHYLTIGDWAGIIGCWVSQCNSYNFLGQYEAARRVAEKAQQAVINQSMYVHQVQVPIMLGDLAYKEERYEEAIGHFQRATTLPFFRSLSAYDRVMAMAYMMRPLMRLKRMREAEQLLKEIEQLSKTHKITSAVPRRVEAQFHASQGRFNKAEQIYKDTLIFIIRKGHDIPALPYVVLGLAQVWQVQRRLEAAARAAHFIICESSTWAADRHDAEVILSDVKPLLRDGMWDSIVQAAGQSSLKAYAEHLIAETATSHETASPS